MPFHETILPPPHEADCPYAFETDRGDEASAGPRITIVSGPSGVGKGTIVHNLMDASTGDDIALSRSHTDRAQRPGEPDDAYVFNTAEEFTALVEAGHFQEWATFVDHRKGSPSVHALADQNERVLLEIDLVGSQLLREDFPDANRVFILPPSRETLNRRLEGRGDQTPDEIAARQAKADEEFASVAALEGYEFIINRDGGDIAAAAQLGALSCGYRLQGPSEAGEVATTLELIVDSSQEIAHN